MKRTERSGPDSHVWFVHALPSLPVEVNRPELGLLQSWWRSVTTPHGTRQNLPDGSSDQLQAVESPGAFPEGGAPGVCALIGIGGAGKTALIDRFLRSLPAGAAEKGSGTDLRPGEREKGPGLPSPSGPNLRAPRGIFVYSFADEPDPDVFFDRLGKWLREAFGGKAPDEEESLCSLTSPASAFGSGPPDSPPLLVVLDGLDMVQETGAQQEEHAAVFEEQGLGLGSGSRPFAGTGRVGAIAHGAVQEWIEWAASGEVAGLAVLLSSRWPVIDSESRSQFPAYHEIPVFSLPPEVSVELLRLRGVGRGEEEELERLAMDCGCHALSLHLLGGYIARFCDGYVSQLPDDPRFRHARLTEEDDSLDPESLRLRAAERALVSVADRYRTVLKEQNTAALEVLLRLALFRVAVTANMIACTMLAEVEGQPTEGIFGESPDAEEIEESLTFLTALSLVQRRTAGESLHLYTLHPALRDALLIGRDENELLRDHLAAKEGLEQILSERPGAAMPASGVVLNLLEEIFYHALSAGRALEAYNIYLHRFGGYWNLGGRLSDWERGERLCRRLCEATHPAHVGHGERLPRQTRSMILSDHGRYLLHLGRLEEALASFEAAGAHMRGGSETLESQLIFGGAWALFLRGRLETAGRVLESALGRGGPNEPPVEILALLALVRFLRGDVEVAEALRIRAFETARRPETTDTSNRTLGYCLATFLVCRGEFKNAAQMVDAVRRDLRVSEDEEVDTSAFWDSVYAGFLLNRGRRKRAVPVIKLVERLPRRSMLVRCLIAFVRARLETASGETEDSKRGKEPEAKESKKGHEKAQSELPEDETGQDSVNRRDPFEAALQLCRRCGFGLIYNEILIERARFRLRCGDEEGAETDLLTALYGQRTDETADSEPPATQPSRGKSDAGQEGGTHVSGRLRPLDGSSRPRDRGLFPPEESGRPALFALTHPECNHVWDEIEARLVLARVLCLRAGFPFPETKGQIVGGRAAARDAETIVTPAPETETAGAELDAAGGVEERSLKEELEAAGEGGMDTSFSPTPWPDVAITPPGGTASPLHGTPTPLPAGLSPEARSLVTRAKVELKRCVELRRQVFDPREKEIRRLLAFLSARRT